MHSSERGLKVRRRVDCVNRAVRGRLLLGTALASTLLIAAMAGPPSASAQIFCPQPPGGPIELNETDPIICINGFAIDNPAGSAIALSTSGAGNFIDVLNSGNLSAEFPVISNGIYAVTFNDNSPIEIVNSGDILVNGGLDAYGIMAATAGAGSTIYILNDGVVTVYSGGNARGIRAHADNAGVTIINNGNFGIVGVNYAFGIYGDTDGSNNPINIENRGDITVGGGVSAFGIRANADSSDSPIGIANSGRIIAIGGTGYAFGIVAYSDAPDSPISILNSGDITAEGDNEVFGIRAATEGIYSPIGIINSAAITAESRNADASAISALGELADSPIGIVNYGALTVFADGYGFGIVTDTFDPDSPIGIINDGDIRVTAGESAFGIFSETVDPDSPIGILNSGDITAIGDFRALGIIAEAHGAGSPIGIENNGEITARASGGTAKGIYAYASDYAVNTDSPIAIVNSGDITVVSGGGLPFDIAAHGIHGRTFAPNSGITIDNSGDIGVTATGTNTGAAGIRAAAIFPGGPVVVRNRGNLRADADNSSYGIFATASYADLTIENSGGIEAVGGRSFGIFAGGFGPGGSVDVVNSGDIISRAAGVDAYGIFARADDAISIENSAIITAVTTGLEDAYGMRVLSFGPNSPIDIVNRGDITAISPGIAPGKAQGIHAGTIGIASPISITNNGNIFADGINSAAIYAFSFSDILVVNTGSISSSSLLAINTAGTGSATIVNSSGGVITGFVDLANSADTFLNQSGGMFEARLTSAFGLGDDLFRNAAGGTVHTADNSSVAKHTAFVELERFDNSGLISLVDDSPGDVFRISQVPGAPDDYFYNGGIVFNGSGDSTLAVDTFLGGPGSTSDIVIIDGDVTGETVLQVNNTNRGPGLANAVIPVVYVGGNVQSDAFFLPQPIDTGFFNYDLFFEPAGSGIFELRSFLGGGAFLLPQLITAAQDTWHAGSSTWFDRTADLRVLLAGGGAPIAYDPTARYADAAPAGSAAFTPAVWARGGGNWLDRDGSESVSAFGNDYRYKLDRDLEILDWQMGLDLGKRDLLSPGDILVFGVLGGFVNADLDYDQLARAFDFEGGQIGGYATYLRGGLFVDTLLNLHLLDLETATLGFPSSLDATTVGLRTDTGYRFGSFNGGAFIEPLATLSVLWADIDGFSLGGNTVSFDDEANVRGRLGLRVGTSYPAWTGTTIEPFVIGSLWGNLSGDNQATLTSSGTTFRFEDDLDDVWGEVSAGVNFFNPSAATSVFAKVDVTFGDDVDGIGGKAGMRVSW